VRRPLIATPGMSRAARTRARLAAALVSVLLLGVGYRAWDLQIAEGDHFRDLAARQQLHTIEIPAPRGAILDARNRPLAISADAESVYVDPRAIVDVAGTSEHLAAALGLDVNQVEFRLASSKRFAWIARHVTPEQAQAVRAAKLVGVVVTHEPRRWYPEQTSGGTVIGFAGLDGNGLDGLELKMDGVLAGAKARFAALRDARGKTMLDQGVTDATPGATVELTLDRSIQHIADEALAASVTTNKAKSGVAIVLDVRTGVVLAMSTIPTYDPNDPAAAIKADARNRAITDVYEIGSVMKVFTIAAGLDLGVIRPNESWNVEGGAWMAPGKKRVTDVHHDTILTTGGILKRSSNVGATKVGLRIGRERLYAGLRKLGFGEKSGIDLPGEQPGRIRDGSTWRDVELVTISWGYGLTVTPIQIAAAMAAIGNGGIYNPPRVVERVTGPDGKVAYQRPTESRAIMKPSTAAALLPMLKSVFDKGKRPDQGTGHNIEVPGFLVGGKSGTAHKYDPATRKYAPHRYLSSFAGLAPIADPRIAIVVVVDDPSGGDYFGGAVAGPVFGQIASATLRYLGVPGDAPIVVEPPAKGARAGKPSAAPTPPPMPIVDEEDGPADELAGLVDDPDDDGVVMPTVPDFRGLGAARALAEASQRGVSVELQGSGRCARQSVAPGARSDGTAVVLELE